MNEQCTAVYADTPLSHLITLTKDTQLDGYYTYLNSRTPACRQHPHTCIDSPTETQHDTIANNSVHRLPTGLNAVTYTALEPTAPPSTRSDPASCFETPRAAITIPRILFSSTLRQLRPHSWTHHQCTLRRQPSTKIGSSDTKRSNLCETPIEYITTEYHLLYYLQSTSSFETAHQLSHLTRNLRSSDKRNNSSSHIRFPPNRAGIGSGNPSPWYPSLLSCPSGPRGRRNRTRPPQPPRQDHESLEP